MRRFLVIANSVRGDVKPPEPLDDAGQYAANVRADLDDAEDRSRLRYRATAHVRFERDPRIERGEDWPGKKPAASELYVSLADRIERLARRA